MKQYMFKVVFLLLVIVAALPYPASALSIKAVSIEEMLKNSALVIEGQVVGTETRRLEGSRFVQTCVTVAIAEIVKGSHQGNSLHLCFLGGRLGDTNMRIPGMRYPVVGETGIYFVESPGRDQVHPFYGGPQGHFLVVPDPSTGEEQVLTVDRKPVVGVTSSVGLPDPGLSVGVARGILTAKPPQAARIMTKAEFKQSLRAMLDKLPQ